MKTGKGEASKAQVSLYREFKRLGKADQYRFINIPFSEIPPKQIFELVKTPAALKAFPDEVRLHLINRLHERLPKETPVWAALDLYARLLAQIPEDYFN